MALPRLLGNELQSADGREAVEPIRQADRRRDGVSLSCVRRVVMGDRQRARFRRRHDG